MPKAYVEKQDHDRVIIHFDYDAFYASVVENENPALKSVPLAIQQKQIVVTCNYEARRRGLHKLQLITEAKRVCPDAVIILGEDLTRFRNASKDLCQFLRERIWSDKVERLGFDEVWLDVTDMINDNMALLNENDLENSFFCLDRDDPLVGFKFDARHAYGPTYPEATTLQFSEPELTVYRRLVLGSHLARHLRHELAEQKGYTATVGIATNKVLSKLVGNVNKPRNQTTLVPSLYDRDGNDGTIHTFMDGHDIGKVPGIGFKLAQKIRGFVLGRDAAYSQDLVYGGTKENVTVRDVRLHPKISAERLEEILGGPGAQHGIGGKIWYLINGYDDSEVSKAKRVPSSLSQEDSYMKYLHTFDQVRHQLLLLTERLIRRMHIDLMEDDDDTDARRWSAHPKTLRLTTRPRPPLNADGTRSRTFNRISHSAPLPAFVFSLTETPAFLAEKLVETTLVHMFRRLHSDRNGWNLSLINIAVTNMAETATDSKDSKGRDIGRMFRRQEDVLKDFRVTESEPADSLMNPQAPEVHTEAESPAVLFMQGSNGTDDDANDWDDTDDQAEDGLVYDCPKCGQTMPVFAVAAHARYHDIDESS